MRKKKYLKQILWMFSVFTIMGIMLFGAGKDIYAKKKDYIGKLEPGHTYYSNLDRKGKREKIYVKDYWTEDIQGIILYINGKQVLKDGWGGEYVELNLYVIDTNKNDDQMEIIAMRDTSIMQVKYYRYKSNKFKKVQDFDAVGRKKYKSFKHLQPLTDEFSEDNHGIMFRGNGKGKLTTRCCIQLKNNLGTAQFKDTLTLKKGKFTFSNKKTFKLLGDNSYSENAKDKSVLRSKGTNKVYKKPGSSKVVFKLKDKEKFYRKEIYIKDKKTYVSD